MRPRFSFIALAATTLAACSMRGSNAPTPAAARLSVRQTDSAGVVHGVVLDSAGRPFREAIVNAQGTTVRAHTDSLGRFRLVVPSGRIVLRTFRVGYSPVLDTLSIAGGHGADVAIDLPAGEPAVYVDVSFSDVTTPSPAVLLDLKWPLDDTIPFAVVTMREAGRSIKRDSIPREEFSADELLHVALWEPSSPSPLVLTSIEVRVPGYRIWRREAVTTPVTLTVKLERISSR